MNGIDYQYWMMRAFLSVEAVLAAELCAATSYINEEYVRTALVKGLVMSRPADAYRVTTEEDAPWSANVCQNHPTCTEHASGRSIQHDVGILGDPGDLADHGLRCEVKWLKAGKAEAVAMDVWKLALSRGVGPENSAQRTYLLIGGHRDAFAETLATLAEYKLVLRKQPYGQKAPEPSLLRLEAALAATTKTGYKGLVRLLSWGDKPKHMRDPPPCRRVLRATMRAWWALRTPGVPHWRAVLWELHAHGLPQKYQGTIAWPMLPYKCP